MTVETTLPAAISCKRLLAVALTLSATLIIGCAQQPVETSPSASALTPRTPASAPHADDNERDGAKKGDEALRVSLGTGVMFNAPQSKQANQATESGPVTLNFENGDIREIVKNLLGDLLNESFIIDPAVNGTVTVRTARGIKRTDVIPMLETLLRTVKAVMVKDGNYWRILPEAGITIGTVPPRTQVAASNGASVVIYPARFIGAKELERVITPFVKQPATASMRVDELRNLVFFTGTEAEIRAMMDIADMFDVSLLKGMSFLLHPLESSEVKDVAADWEKIFPAATNPFAGLLRVVPIERMNAVLLIAPQREVILEAKDWLERLDKGGSSASGTRLYVYYVQYGEADRLQSVLQQAVGSRGGTTGTTTSSATVAPGQTTSALSPRSGQNLVRPGNQTQTSITQQSANQVRTNTPTAGATNNPNQPFQRSFGTDQASLARNATVIADPDRNALLITATPSEYSAIEAAIKKLDTPPKQVAIDVQIAQVSLTGNLTFGLKGFFTGSPGDAVNRLRNGFGTSPANDKGTALAGNGLVYSWNAGNAASLILNTLQTNNQARLIANPTLLTLENKPATFSSGQDISVLTQTTSGSAVANATNSYQYINTGISINVTPRVSGKNMFMDISLEISDAQAVSTDGANPTIDSKRIQTHVMVQTGDTLLLGGFILDKGGNSKDGLPGLSMIPIVGGLFGGQSWNTNRSELVMLVTPRVLSTIEETRDVVDELRSRLLKVQEIAPHVSVDELPASSEGREAAIRRREENKLRAIEMEKRLQSLNAVSGN